MLRINKDIIIDKDGLNTNVEYSEPIDDNISNEELEDRFQKSLKLAKKMVANSFYKPTRTNYFYNMIKEQSIEISKESIKELYKEFNTFKYVKN